MLIASVDRSLPWLTSSHSVRLGNERASQARAAVGACVSSSRLRSSMSLVFSRGLLRGSLPFPSLRAAIKCHTISFLFFFFFELQPVRFLGKPDLCHMQGCGAWTKTPLSTTPGPVLNSLWCI